MKQEEILKELNEQVNKAEKVLKEEEKNKYGKQLKYESRCKICKSESGEKINEERANGMNYKDIITAHPDLKLNITNLHTHFKNHFITSKKDKETSVVVIPQKDIIVTDSEPQHLVETIAKKTYSLLETHGALANDMAKDIESLRTIEEGIKSTGSLTAQDIDSITKINNVKVKAEATLSSILQAMDKKMFPSSASVNFLQNYVHILRKTALAIATSYNDLISRVKKEADPIKKDEMLDLHKEELKIIFKDLRDELYQKGSSTTF